MKKLKLERKETKKQQSSGITLIALVITIIVLLILAGISISMLTGQNGILTKAGDVKKQTDIEQIIENAQIDIMGQQTENKGSNITKGQLATLLNKYFETVNETDIPNEISDTSDIDLTTIDKKYTIKLSKIFKGSFLHNSYIEELEDGEAKLYCNVIYNEGHTSAVVNVRLKIGGLQTIDEWLNTNYLHGIDKETWYVNTIKQAIITEIEGDTSFASDEEKNQLINQINSMGFVDLMKLYNDRGDFGSGLPEEELPKNLNELCDERGTDDFILFQEDGLIDLDEYWNNNSHARDQYLYYSPTLKKQEFGKYGESVSFEVNEYSEQVFQVFNADDPTVQITEEHVLINLKLDDNVTDGLIE